MDLFPFPLYPHDMKKRMCVLERPKSPRKDADYTWHIRIKDIDMWLWRSSSTRAQLYHPAAVARETW